MVSKPPRTRSKARIGQLGVKPGPSGAKGDWALTQYIETPIPTVRRKTGVPIWAFQCKWCTSIRTTERSPGCEKWDDELPQFKDFNRTNFISHIKGDCPGIPWELKFYHPERQQDASMTAGATTMYPLTQKQFSSALTKAVVRDNYSMTFGEGPGMIEFFHVIYPSIRLPSHQTLQRYLYRLYEYLSIKVKDELKAVERHAIATDAWSSKNSVYSLAGLIIFYIDSTWKLTELVLDVIDLDAEHLGAHMGKLVYKSLKSRDMAHRSFGCMTDNASANSVMNTTLANHIRARENIHLDGKAMSFTCVVHAYHLVCVAILSHLGVIEPGDHFTEVKSSEAYAESDLDEEEEELGPETASGAQADEDEATDSSDTDSESDSDFEEGLIKEMEETDGRKRGRGQNKGLRVTEKVHEIVIYVSASPKRQRAMRRIISQTCAEHVKHLFFKKSMRIRWGSVLAEIERAITLRPALIHFVANLDSGKQGKSLNKARKLQDRWTIKREEWDILGILIELLMPFQSATKAMSRRDVPTIAEVIPTFAFLERKLVEAETKL